MNQVRFGVIGVGNMGSTHAKNLFADKIKGAVLAAICDINPERQTWAKETFENKVPVFDNAEKMMDSGLVDAVIIAVPHYDHPILGMLALNKGLNVVCEKPIGVYTKKAEEFLAVAAKSDKVITMMFNQRTNPVFQKVHDMVQGGELGELKRSIWIITDWYRSQSYYNSGGWRATWGGEGGGVLINQCPHNLDLWQWMCGMPSKVRAFCHFGKNRNIEVEDDVTAYVEYPNGATGIFVTSVSDAPGTNRLEVTGSMGKLVLENRTDLKFYKLSMDEREFNKTYTGGFGSPEVEVIDIKVEGEETAHCGILQNFTNAILHGEKLLAPVTEGIKGLTLSNAMQLSTWIDKTVDLPIDGDLYYEKLQEHVKSSTYVKPEAAGATLNTAGSY